MRYLLTRLGHAVLLLWGVSLLSFFFFQLAPGDFFSEMRLNPQISSEVLAGLRAQYGLDQPMPVRYGRWLMSLARGEAGFSFAYNGPVVPLLMQRAQNTLLLTSAATLLAWLIAVPLGIWSASRPGKLTDSAVTATSATLMGVPDLLIALGLLMLAVRTGILPAGGMSSLGAAELGLVERARDVAAHMVIPVFTLVLGLFPSLVRHVRAAMREALAAPCLQAAAAHGIPPRRILFRYGLAAAANPLISLFGLSLGALFSGSLLVEVIMSWPGLGPLLLDAVLARDVHLVIGCVMLSAVFLVLGNLLADLLLYWADPRIRVGA